MLLQALPCHSELGKWPGAKALHCACLLHHICIYFAVTIIAASLSKGVVGPTAIQEAMLQWTAMQPRLGHNHILHKVALLTAAALD
jgi:hypothetical protein